MTTIAKAPQRNVDLESALVDARAAFVKRNPNSGAIYEEALSALPGGNTRTVLFYAPYPLTMAKGQGAYLWDADGHKYIDFLGEYTAGLFGHSHPVIRKAIDRALDGGISFGSHNPMEGKLAKLVQARFPSVELLRFTTTGTEAVMSAVRVARAFTGRSGVVRFAGNYHGHFDLALLDAGASAQTGDAAKSGIPAATLADVAVARYNDLADLDRVLAGRQEGLAAILTAGG